MLRIVLLTNLLHLIINAGFTNGLDEGSFLWAQRRADNLSSDKGSGVRPGRWTRSVFNWLHSPLINSIQEAFVADSIYDNSPPATKYVKRSIAKNNNASDVNLEESFENEFFLWEDNEGNPLEFGLKQIQDLLPSRAPLHNYRRFNRDQTDNLWEEPLVYEYNQDVKDIDVNHLSYHEKFKLNDIFKKKLHNPFHMFPFRHSTTHTSKYYTLDPSAIISSPITCAPVSTRSSSSSTQKLTNRYHFPYHIKNKYKYQTSSEMSEQNTATEIGMKDTFGKQSSYYLFSSVNKGNHFTELTTQENPNSENVTVIGNAKFIAENVKGTFVPLKPWLDLREVNLHREETPHSLNDNFNNHSPMNLNGIQKNASDDASNHRKLRTAHHKRFLKYRRKNDKRKNNKLKYPVGHSYQYELFNGNFKSSG